MFIFTAKVPRRKLALGVTLAALACCCLFALDLGPSPAQAAAASAPGVKGVRTNQDRVDFLRSFGWEVAEEPLATQEMVIPQELDDSYAQYIDLQRQQGFDLERYAGKRAKRYTYEILNYPSGETGVQANLLLYKTTVIGGEVLSPRLDGFLHGLAMPETGDAGG